MITAFRVQLGGTARAQAYPSTPFALYSSTFVSSAKLVQCYTYYLLPGSPQGFSLPFHSRYPRLSFYHAVLLSVNASIAESPSRRVSVIRTILLVNIGIPGTYQRHLLSCVVESVLTVRYSEVVLSLIVITPQYYVER